MTDDEIALWLITKGTMEDKPIMALAADRILTLRAERDRLRETLTDAWDAHNKHGDQMSGWWVHDDALKGETL